MPEFKLNNYTKLFKANPVIALNTQSAQNQQIYKKGGLITSKLPF